MKKTVALITLFLLGFIISNKTSYIQPVEAEIPGDAGGSIGCDGSDAGGAGGGDGGDAGCGADGE